MKLRNLFRILCCTLPLILSGCAASFHQGLLDPVDRFPSVTVKNVVFVDLAFTGEFNGEPWKGADANNTTFLKELCLDRLRASGMFGRISTDANQSDLQLYIAIINSREASPNKELLTACTLGIIPFKSTDTFHLQAIARNPYTGEQHVFKLKDEVTHWQEILMSPLSLFFSSSNAMEECRNRLLDNLCLEVQRSGMLK